MWTALFAAGAAWAAERIEVCTDRGGLVADVADDGALTGWVGGWRVTGTTDALTLVARTGAWDTPTERPFWSGPLASLHPTPPPPRPTPEQLAIAFTALNTAWKARGARVLGRSFRGDVGPDGALRGRLSGEAVVFAQNLGGDGFFGGLAAADALLAALPGALTPPLEFLDGAETMHLGRTDRASALGRVVAENLRQLDVLPDCPLAGRDAFYVGEWPDPLPLPPGRNVVYATYQEALLRGPEGPTWFRSLRLNEADAAGLAEELAEQWPTRQTSVAWADGRALVRIGLDPAVHVPGVAAKPRTMSLAPLLDVDPAVLVDTPLPRRAADAERSPDSTTLPIFGPGREIVARLNLLRREAGLPDVVWDETLAWSAMGHCAYLDKAQRDGRPYPKHDETPGTPLFLGVAPQNRAGAAEVIVTARQSAPHVGTDRWVEAPFHRAWPMHPRAARAGACISLQGAMVLEVGADWRRDVAATSLYPAPNARAVPRTFDGYEDPDPLPIERHPDKTLPVGYTLTGWLEGLGGELQIERAWVKLATGELVPFYAVARPEDIDPKRVIVHLIPKEPLPAGAQVSWGLVIRYGDQTRNVNGAFTVADEPSSATVTLDPLSSRAKRAVDARRVGAGLPPLAATVRGQTIARLYAHGGWDNGPWPKPAHTIAMCFEPVVLEALLTHDVHGDALDGWVSPNTQLFGAANNAAGDICLIVASDPMWPVRPDQEAR